MIKTEVRHFDTLLEIPQIDKKNYVTHSKNNLILVTIIISC